MSLEICYEREPDQPRALGGGGASSCWWVDFNRVKAMAEFEGERRHSHMTIAVAPVTDASVIMTAAGPVKAAAAE